MPCNPRSCTCGKYTAPLRHVVGIIIALGLMVGYCQRVAISIAIVEMVVVKVKAKNATECPTTKNITAINKVGSFQGVKRNWNEHDQSIILLSFYIGYLIMHMPFGILIDKFGSRWFLAGGVLVSSIATALVPLIVQNFEHYAYVTILRIITGAGQSCLYPGITSTLSRWIPRAERATFGSVVYSANSIGSILGTLISGLLIYFFNSWPLVFYFWALVGIWWICMFLLYVYSDPAFHPHIFEEEKELIMSSVAKKNQEPAPAKRIFSDMAVWALIVGQVGYSYVHFLLITNLPKYMFAVLNFNIKGNALASSLPYLAQYISSIAFGHLADYFITKKKVKVIIIRKVYTAIAMIGASLMILLAGYSRCNSSLAIACFVLALLCKGLYYSGLKVNVMDITTSYAAFVMSIINTFASIPGIVSPFVIGKVAKDNTFAQWDIIFWVTFGFSVTCCTIYLIFGKVDRKSWDYTPEQLAAKVEDDKKEEENKKLNENKPAEDKTK